ncbi:PH domain-containing protein [Rubripirellula amarantea]|nr:PH domain-containing protein [Rubripirellula amarantea]
MTHRVYDSAIDAWVAALLIISPLSSVIIGVYLFLQGQSDDASIMFAAGAFTTMVIVACTLPCRYTLLEDAISIRCGIILFYQVAYTDIESADLSSSWLSGPALSLKRIAIKTKRRTIIVSPKDREQFLSELNERIANAGLDKLS